MARPTGPIRWYDRVLDLDRRWIYLLLALSIVIPTVWSFRVPTAVSGEVRSVYDFVEGLQPGETLFLAIDYDPSTLAELHPMTEAVFGQALDRGAHVLLTALSQFAPSMAEELIERVAKEHGKTRGRDYVFLGYKPYPALTITAMGVDFRVPFPTDYYGTPLDAIPMMRDLHNYKDVRGVITVAATTTGDMWITYGNAKYGVPVAIGTTGVMASDYYPYLESGQIFGLISGMKGAAEYERLTGRAGRGSEGMPYQVATHVVILLGIVLSNLADLARRRAGSGRRGE